MPDFTLPKIYPITDRFISGLSHLEQVRRLAQGGGRFIQIRDKSAPAGEFYDSAVEVMRYAHELGLTIIVNDRVDIALASGADGVHLGQDDLPPDEARRLLGESAIIGYSTHSTEQALRAMSLPVDYIAIGPIFSTSTKEDPDPVVGLDGLRSVREGIGVFPLVAIGGINRGNAREVLGSGADSLAVISDLLSDPAQMTARILELSRA